MTAIDPQQQNGGPPILPGGTAQVDPAMVTNAILNAMEQCATAAAGTNSGAEAKDFLQAALFGAQAVVVLDPSLSQGGTPLEHDLALEQLRGQTQQNVAAIQGEAQKHVADVQAASQLRAAKETAAAPTPRKKLTINRENGRMTGITQEG